MKAHYEFWVILRANKEGERRQHSSFESAQFEAAELASNDPNTEFYILKATHVTRVPPRVETVALEQMPF